MRSPCLGHLALACLAVLCPLGSLASSSLRHSSKLLPDASQDAEVAEAEALANQAEAEASQAEATSDQGDLGDSVPTAAPVVHRHHRVHHPHHHKKHHHHPAHPAVATQATPATPATPPTPAIPATPASAAAPVAQPIKAAPLSVAAAKGHRDKSHHQRQHHHHSANPAVATPAAAVAQAIKAAPLSVAAARGHRDESTYFLREALKPKPEKAKIQNPLSSALNGGGLSHWGDAVHAAVDSLKGNATKQAAKASKAKMPAHASTHAKNAVKDEAREATDQHSTVRRAVRATVKQVLPGKRSREAMRKLPEDVTRHVGEKLLKEDQVPTAPQKKQARKAEPKLPKHAGQVAYRAAPISPKQQRSPPPAGLTEHSVERTQDAKILSARRGDAQVEPGIAYGHGVPHSSEDEKALEEARRLEEKEESRRQARLLKEEEQMAEGALKGVSSNPSASTKKRNLQHEVEDLEEQITEETKSESLAYMLGGVKMDLYQLNEKMDMLQKDIEDGVPMDPTVVGKDYVYPLSACMRCIFMLSAQYFLLYTAAVVCKVFVDVFGLGPGCTAEKALRAACDTVSYAPMLCVLFLGAHLRATQITLGKQGPQEWAETAMQVCAWSCLVQTLMVLMTPFFTGKTASVDSEGNLRGEAESSAGFLTFVRFVSLVGLYAGFTVVCIAVVLMDARSLGAKPVNIWDDPRTAATEYAPPVSVAMVCTISLTLFFFVVHLLHAFLWSCKELLPKGGPATSQRDARAMVTSWEECLRSCTSAVNLAPMLCILFIAARMRALQMDPRRGRPQRWAEACFYVCVGSVIAQTLLIIVAKILGARQSSDPFITARASEDARTSPQMLVLGLSYLAMTVTFGACSVVMCSIFLLEAEKGGKTPPLSPAMFCVLFLVALYLVVFLCVFLAQVAADASKQSSPQQESPRAENLQRVLAKCKSAENTVKLAPMLAVLFVAARMRALQMSNQKGSPQCWSQDAMYMASLAVFLQLCVVIASGATASTVEVDQDGTLLTTRVKYLPGRIFLECLKATTFLMLFGGVFAIVASILTIRPETAQCVQ